MESNLHRSTRERHERLLTVIRSGHTSVHVLAKELGVSSSTVRRDLARLNETGAITRIYGGATSGVPFRERDLRERLTVEVKAKAAIGQVAASLVPERGIIFVDAGSTCGQLAEHLAGRAGLTVLTRGIEIAVQLAGSAELELVMIGGDVARKSHGLVGPLAELALERYTVDVAFLGVDALDPVDGVGEPTLSEAYVKEQVALRARKVVVLADAAKLSRGTVPVWAPLPQGWTLVTNERDATVLDRYRSCGVKVIST